MTAKEIYALIPREESKEIDVIGPDNYNFLEELNDSRGLYDIKNELIIIKYYVSHCFDGRRIWELASVWYDGTPFMIFQRGGREGDDHTARFITDEKTFEEALDYIRSLMPKETINDIIDPEKNLLELTDFYNHTLSDFYDPDFTPDYSVGDIITVLLPQTLNSRDDNFMSVNVKILSVCDNPYDCYRVEEMDRMIHHGGWMDKEDKSYLVSKAGMHLFPGVKFEPKYWRLDKNLEQIKEY